ncbi:MAG: Hsp33 family molecular chaperone HslO [Acidobacteria bacterium]|nr:MAG: Hsp33 family molecular chaperone HslO [Acidobacteriota bacterium]REK00210.1 MAG: Hsp33 family molecular chaperone HslO [Acidobacteriota bacterium]
MRADGPFPSVAGAGATVLAGTASAGQLRFVAAELTSAVEEARRRLDLGPLSTLAFSHTALAAAMLLPLAAKRPHRLEVEVLGDGLVGKVMVEARSDGGLRGTVQVPRAVGEGGVDDLRLDAAFGKGLLRVRRVDERGSRYESQVGLVQGDLALDLAHYLDQSEQRRAAVLFGVRLDARGLRRCGGLIVEALPGTSASAVDEVERRIRELDSVHGAVESRGAEGVETLLAAAIGEHHRVHDRWPVGFRCGCSREGLRQRLLELGGDQLRELFETEETVSAECAYCAETYLFEREDLLEAN